MEKTNHEWCSLRDRFKEQYQTKRRELASVKTKLWQKHLHREGDKWNYEAVKDLIDEEKIKILKEIHQDLVDPEIERIHQKERSHSPSHYPLFQRRDNSKWNEGLEQDVDTLWDDYFIKRYVFHGTNLGIAAISLVRGQLGGMQRVTERLNIDGEFSKEQTQVDISSIFFFKPEDFIRDRTGKISLGNLVHSSIGFADRMACFPARSILTYYTFRAAWEEEQRQEPFPPLEYFQQRAVLLIQRIGSYGAGRNGLFFSEGYSSEPISTKDSLVILDKNIPLPRLHYTLGNRILSTDDPENIWPYDNQGSEKMEAIKERLRAGVMGSEEILKKYSHSIGNQTYSNLTHGKLLLPQ